MYFIRNVIRGLLHMKMSLMTKISTSVANLKSYSKEIKTKMGRAMDEAEIPSQNRQTRMDGSP